MKLDSHMQYDNPGTQQIKEGKLKELVFFYVRKGLLSHLKSKVFF